MAETSPLRDEQLMQSVAAGDEGAFGELFDRYWKAIVSFLVRVTGNAALAEELAQNTFVRLLEHRARYDPARSFRTWIFTIARRLSYNEIEKRSPEHQGELPASADERSDEPSAALSHKEAAAAVREALDRLAPPLREVLLLRAVEGLPYRDIAEIVAANESTVRTRMDSAARALRRMLSKA